ncbi:MAG: RDD family protein [Rubrivivax sp.]
MLYEGVLLFGVLMLSGLLYGTVTQQRHALVGTHGLQVFVFVVLGTYFVTFWSRGGQTLAMKTWRVRLLTRSGGPVTVPRAIARYLASWLWCLPALAIVGASGRHGSTPVALALGANAGLMLLLARLQPTRQFVHDRLCGTMLVDTRSARH